MALFLFLGLVSFMDEFYDRHMDEFNERRYWLSLSVCNGIGPTRFQKLLHHFGSAKHAWFANEKEIIDSRIGEKVSQELAKFRNTFSIDRYEEKMQKMEISYLTLQDKGYPDLLKLIKRPPPEIGRAHV